LYKRQWIVSFPLKKRDSSSARRVRQLQNSCRDALRVMATSTKNRLGWNRTALLYLPYYRHVTSNMNIFLLLGRSSLLVSSASSLGRSRQQMFFHCRWVYRILHRNMQRESYLSYRVGHWADALMKTNHYVTKFRQGHLPFKNRLNIYFWQNVDGLSDF
jgi:hypothetical protein